MAADWRKGVEWFVEKVESKLDEKRARYGLAGKGQARIEAYRSFGTPDRAFIRGRVLRGAPIPPSALEDSVIMNLAAMIQRFESDEVAGARVLVRYPGGEEVVTTDAEGYFECWLDPRPPLAPHALWHEVVLELVHPVAEGTDPHRVITSLLVPPESSAFGVISDLDDTVIRTDVTQKLRMLRTVLLGNARTRSPFPGVAAFYHALQQGTGAHPFNPIFYVSSSPWNLYDLLVEFLQVQKIPVGPLMLRDWGFGGGEVSGNERHKLEAIRRVLDLYPALPFLLIGDSGQEDPEIYHRVVHDYPDRIRAVYIRNVHPSPLRADAIRALAAEVERAGSTLVLADDTLAAARHAASQGWIRPESLADIGEGAHAEERTSPPGTERTNEALSRNT